MRILLLFITFLPILSFSQENIIYRKSLGDSRWIVDFLQESNDTIDITNDLQFLIDSVLGDDVVLKITTGTYFFHDLNISNKETVDIYFESVKLIYPPNSYNTRGDLVTPMLSINNCKSVILKGDVDINGQYLKDNRVVWNRHTSESASGFAIIITHFNDGTYNEVDVSGITFHDNPLHLMQIAVTNEAINDRRVYPLPYRKVKVHNIRAFSAGGIVNVRGNFPNVTFEDIDVICDTMSIFHISAANKQISFSQNSIAIPRTKITIKNIRSKFGNAAILFLQNYKTLLISNVQSDYFGCYEDAEGIKSIISRGVAFPEHRVRYSGGQVLKIDNRHFYPDDRATVIQNFITTNTSRFAYTGSQSSPNLKIGTNLGIHNSIWIDEGTQFLQMSNCVFDARVQIYTHPGIANDGLPNYSFSQMNNISNCVFKRTGWLRTGRRCMVNNCSFFQDQPLDQRFQVATIQKEDFTEDDDFYPSYGRASALSVFEGGSVINNCNFFSCGITINQNTKAVINNCTIYGKGLIQINRDAVGTDSTHVIISNLNGGRVRMGPRGTGDSINDGGSVILLKDSRTSFWSGTLDFLTNNLLIKRTYEIDEYGYAIQYID